MNTSDTTVTVPRLAVLDALILLNGLSRQELSRKMGLSPSAAQHWFFADDIKLPLLAQALEVCGYQAYFSMCTSPRDIPKVETLLTKDRPLRFLVVSMNYYELTRDEIAKKTGRPLSTVTSWFYRPQTSFATIATLAKQLGMRLFVTYIPIEETNRRKETKCSLVQTIKKITYKSD